MAAALSAAAAGRAATVLVAGGAGLGATRFLDEAFARAEAGEDAPLVLRGRAHGPVDPPWAAVIEALAPALVDRPPEELLGLLRRDAGPMLRRVPALAAAARGIAVPRTSALADPERRQPRALEALLRWLGRRAVERPIVLVLEDLHVADAATRSFATFVARIAHEERIGLVLSYQPDRLTREHPLRENLGDHQRRAAPPGHGGHGAVHARRDRVADRGDRGRTALRVDRGAGVGALRRLRGRRRGAGRGAARAAQRVADRDAVRHRRGAARPPLARVPPAAAAARAGGAPGEPGRARRRGRRLRGRRHHPAPAPFGHRPAARARTSWTPTSRPASTRPWSTGSCVARRTDELAIRHELVARAIVADLLPSQRPRYHAALAQAFAGSPVVAAAFLRRAHRLDAARAVAIDAGRLAIAVEAPQDALAVLERGLDLPAPAADRHPLATGHRGRSGAGRARRRRGADGDPRRVAGPHGPRRRGRVRRRAADPRRRLRGERARGARPAVRPAAPRGPRGAAGPVPDGGRRRRPARRPPSGTRRTARRASPASSARGSSPCSRRSG